MGTVTKDAASAFRLQLCLIRGSGLVVRDSTGSSDPYVVMRIGDRLLGKSRVIYQCLEPEWNEEFNFPIDNLAGDLELRVYDHDFLSLRDDYMGRCLLPLTALCEGQQLSLRLPLSDETGQAAETCMGNLQFTAELQSSSPANCELESAPVPESIVNVSLIDVVGMGSSFGQEAGGEESTQPGRSLYAQLQLGDQICRSRSSNRGHCWDEDLRIPMPPAASSDGGRRPTHLEVSIYERHLTSQNILVGRTRVPLPTDSSSSLSSCGGDLVVAPLLDHPPGGPAVRLILDQLTTRPCDGGQVDPSEGVTAADSCKSNGSIGFLTVRIVAAERLRSGAAGGATAAAIFCTVRLNNSQLSAHVLEASAERIRCRELKFRVRDLHSELEVAVYEAAKRQSSPNLLGRLALRLPQLLDGADSRGRRTGWYGLKDNRLEAWTGGRLKLETRLQYSWIGAALRAIEPKEARLRGRPEPKLRLRLVRRDTRRCVVFLEAAARFGAFASSCFHWEDPVRSAAALACYVAIVWNLQAFMLPLAPLALLLVSLVWQQNAPEDKLCGGDSTVGEAATAGPEDEPDADEQSWLQRARAAQELLLRLQDGLDLAASSAERLRNLATWREPRITGLVAALLALAALVLGLLPLRLLALAWGVNKFSKKLLRPEADDSNELVNLLSRVPSDVDLERTRPQPAP